MDINLNEIWRRRREKGFKNGGGDYEGKGGREGKFCNQKKLRIAVNSTLKVSIHN